MTKYERGSEWRQWDLHIHTPASFHWKGKRFDADHASEAHRALVDEMIKAMNAAEPAVFALMDYWTFDGWFALQRRLQEPDAPTLKKTVFPGIELRLAAPTHCRLNAHVLFSNEIDDQSLHDFKSALTIELVERPLSDAALVALARQVGADKLKHHGFDKSQVDQDDAVALRAGSTIAEINCESYKKAIRQVPNGHAIGFMPYDTSDGLGEVKWQDHYAYFLGLFQSSPIFESRNRDLRDAFVGQETPGNTKFFKNFQAGLNYVPRLVVSGSDAHCFVGVKGDNDRRGYGDYPSGKATWIKADPTFQGLQQAIMEPLKRSYIGARPPKREEIDTNKTYFIDAIEVRKADGTSAVGNWLDGTKLPLNPDLVAIIGNKGSGKSALADVLALLGNSRQTAHFSFLKKERFRGKSGDPARHFVGTLSWLDGNTEHRNLNENPPQDNVELVRYIPQGHFEDLCNAHVSGRSDAFEKELRAVIFSHADDAIRLGALDFDQLVEQQERTYRSQLNEFRKELRGINQRITTCEEQLQPQVKRSLEELLALKIRQKDEHDKIKPAPVAAPGTDLSPEQQAATTALAAVAEKLRSLDERMTQAAATRSQLAGKSKAIQNTKERLRLLARAYQQFMEDAADDLAIMGLTAQDLVTFSIVSKPLDDIEARVTDEQAKLSQSVDADVTGKETLLKEQTSLQAKLDAPQLLYQQHLAAIEQWNAKLAELVGSAEAPDTLEGLRARIMQLDELPAVLDGYRAKREALTGEIFDVLEAQRKAREQLFKPVQDLILGNRLIRDEYKLQFQATLGGSIDRLSEDLFALIKQNAGEFRGDDESFGVVRKLAEQHDFNKRSEAVSFVTKLHDKIAVAASGNSAKASTGLGSMLRKDKSATDVYDLLFGLSFLEPRYSLLFQDTQIEQLSPGQRGALLLIFYLLVDKGRNPIILDQPEENLDNETVVGLLVPVLTEAKMRRQIIMVTHNPNLAVVCDAEQVIWCSFDRKGGSKISYTGGSIENPSINRRVVDVLEGTKPAFNNRRIKYH
ncbi:AAA domain protein [Burkholderia thailandensis MSMB121]|uniref:TrlF family AAA-like ATPase n=1 Tax=Burkholderia humptydooensis TaxID=430531 RepID=UPI00032809B8|nr:ATPase AAA [Burkholderia humptydooensis]AGK49082.1 AAA domain protein [Burkholderia thailandensis MSMB121]ATF37254.1 ABC transporter [Burkholderia thailandensis]KST74626.1 ABC transporter [Burkholderia humptydooensis]